MVDGPSCPRALEMTLRDDTSELERLAEAVDAWVAAVELDPAVAFHLNLSLDELLTNTIDHGIERNGGEHRIEVALDLVDGVVRVRIVDDGRPFDPFAEAPPPDLDSDVDDRPIGGLGVHLVRTFMDSARYERVGDRNVVELTKSVESAV